MKPHRTLPVTVDILEVAWPDGKVERFTAPGVDRVVVLRERGGESR